MKKFILSLGAVAIVATATMADVQVSTLRGPTDLDAQPDAPAIPKVVNTDKRQVRNYPDQPPVIPHKTDGYQIDTNVNQCLTCHSRTAVEISQAPMISVTHFVDRDGQTLASVSPRRYFCTQCHVNQVDARPLVENEFVDVDEVLDYLQRTEEEAK